MKPSSLCKFDEIFDKKNLVCSMNTEIFSSNRQFR